MRIDEAFSKAIQSIYSKYNVWHNIVNNMENIEFHREFGELLLYTKKPYVEKLIKSVKEDLKDRIETVLRTPVRKIKLNDKELKLNLIKEYNPNQTSLQKDQVINSMNQKYKSVYGNKKQKEEQEPEKKEYTREKQIFLEQTIENLIEVKKEMDAVDFKEHVKYMDFYNNRFGNLITFNYDDKIINYKSDYKIAWSLWFTIIIPIVFFISGTNKKTKLFNTKRKIKTLLQRNYKPMNNHAEKFVELFFSEK